MFPQRSVDALMQPVLQLGTVAPTLNGSVGPQDGQKGHISSDSQIQAPEEKATPEQIVDAIALKVLSGMPLRIIDLESGTFSSSAELLRHFKRSQRYGGLLSDKSSSQDDLAERAEEVVCKYFAYVMLSHVWGEDEPLYGDVKAVKDVFAMSTTSAGIRKLQNFCRIAKQRGFRWCWSDTCCIDKTSSAELQESINSMFTWYRNSTLTIAFLLDVLQPTLDALRRSSWFTRGWTLQELLAPAAIEFYMGDWTPFLTPSTGDIVASPNHKLVPEFVQYLEDILGIDKSYLIDFTPGLGDVREKLRWMAARKTTKIEDMAYCLLGILDLRLPVLYGEGDRSFVRLQDEIMKNTDDTGIFDWVGKPSTLNSYLARSPSCFRQVAWRPSPYLVTESSMLETVSNFTHRVSAVLLRVSETLLNDPPLGHFIANGRMNLRTFVYQVTSVSLMASTEVQKRWVYWYHVKADALETVTVVTTYKVSDDRFAARSLSIGRVWDNALRVIPTKKTRKQSMDEPVGDLDTEGHNPWSRNTEYIAELANRLREPFIAQLLIVHPNGQFRRVPTEERIVARPHLSELVNLRIPRKMIVH